MGMLLTRGREGPSQFGCQESQIQGKNENQEGY